MDQISKWKNWNYKTVGRKHRAKSSKPWFGKKILKYDTKSLIQKSPSINSEIMWENKP